MQKQRTSTNQYWCHICQKKFVLNLNSQIQNELVECPYCKQMATQLISSQNHPQKYKAYESNSTNQNATSDIQQLNRMQRNVQQIFNTILPPPPSETVSQQQRNRTELLRNMHSAVSQFMNVTFQNLSTNPQARFFLANIGRLFQQNASHFFSTMNSGTSIPATQQQINKLKTVQNVQQCSICQQMEMNLSSQQYSDINKGFQLDCGHKFHQLCLKPWFEKANTCPTCRKQLK